MSILITEDPLVLNVALAKEIGVNEALVLQQVHYWLNLNKRKKRNFKDGKYWTYNSYEEWQEENFPFWSISTIKRTFKSLENKNLIFTGNFNTDKWNKKKWYSVNYEVADLLGKTPENPQGDASGQNDLIDEVNLNPSVGSKWSDPITETSFTETSKDLQNQPLPLPSDKTLSSEEERFQVKVDFVNEFLSSSTIPITIKLYLKNRASSLVRKNFDVMEYERFIQFFAWLDLDGDFENPNTLNSKELLFITSKIIEKVNFIKSTTYGILKDWCLRTLSYKKELLSDKYVAGALDPVDDDLFGPLYELLKNK